MKKLALAFAVTALFAGAAQAAPEVSGKISGVFKNPVNGTDNAGINTRSFSWGDPTGLGVGANTLTFSGGNFNSAVNTPFKLGTLDYFNGTTLQGTSATAVDLVTKLRFNQADFPNFNPSFKLALHNTQNNSDPIASADYVNFNKLTSSASFVVNGITYKVQLLGFRNLHGDGFLSAGDSEFHVLAVAHKPTCTAW